MPAAEEALIFFATFGDESSPERARSDAVFDKIVGPAAEQHGLGAIRADRSLEPGNLTAQTFRALLTSRAVVCDVTHASPNVFYELGVVHACNIPVVLLGAETDRLPFYVKDERIIRTGEQGSDSFAVAAERLTEALDLVLASTYAPKSVVGQVLGLSGPFPPALRQAVHRASLPLYREGVKYQLNVHEVGPDYLMMRLGLSYTLINRTENSYTQSVGVVPMRSFEPVLGRIGDRVLDTGQPDHLTERGWQVPHEFQAGSETKVAFVVKVKYRMPDADVFATYLPATDFELTVEYPHDKVRIINESHLPREALLDEITDGYRVYKAEGAVLAYGGLRLDWLEPRVLQ